MLFRYHRSISVSDLYKMRDVIEIREQGGSGRMVYLSSVLQLTPTPPIDIEGPEVRITPTPHIDIEGAEVRITHLHLI